MSLDYQDGMLVLHRAKSYFISYQGGGARELWITFNGLGARTAPLKSLIRTRGASAIHVISTGDDWYQNLELSNLSSILAEHNHKRLVLFGVSMGGFAALAFSGPLNADVVLVGAPQTLVDGKITRGIDERFRPWWNSIETSSGFLRPDATSTISKTAQISVLVDPLIPEDRWHVQRLTGQNVSVHAARLAGHEVFEALRAVNVLTQYFHAAVDNDYATVQYCLDTTFKRRRAHPSYWGALAVLAHKRRRPAQAARFVRQALALDPNFLIALWKGKEVFEEIGSYFEARAAVRRLIELLPSDVGLFHAIAHLYAVEGNLKSARFAFLEGLAHYPGNAYLEKEYLNFLQNTGGKPDDFDSLQPNPSAKAPPNHVHAQPTRPDSHALVNLSNAMGPRLALEGDSITAGLFTAPSWSFHALIASKGQYMIPERFNVAVPGATAIDVSQRTAVVGNLYPDAVVLFVGTNDLPIVGHTPDLVRDAIVRSVQNYYRAGASAILVTLIPDRRDEYWRTRPPSEQAKRAQINELISIHRWEFDEDWAIEIINLDTILDMRSDTVDGLHFNAGGARKIGGLIGSVLKEKAAKLSNKSVRIRSNLVAGEYVKFFGRPPDPVEQSYWLERVSTDSEVSHFRKVLGNTHEGVTYARTRINQHYADFLQRHPTNDEFEAWSTELQNGQTYDMVADAIINTAEGYRVIYDSIQSLYVEHAGRFAFGSETDLWVERISRERSFQSLREALGGVVS